MLPETLGQAPIPDLYCKLPLKVAYTYLLQQEFLELKLLQEQNPCTIVAVQQSTCTFSRPTMHADVAFSHSLTRSHLG